MADFQQLGHRYLHVEERHFGRKPTWERYYTQVDYDSSELVIYTDETKKIARRRINLEGCEFLDAVKTKNRACTVKIQPQAQNGRKAPKPIFLSAEELRVIDEFKVDLEECSGIFGGMDRVVSSGGCGCTTTLFPASGINHRIARVPLLEWTIDDVQEWLRLTDLKGAVGVVFQGNDVDGSVLSEMDAATATSLGVTETDLERLMTEVVRIQKAGIFNSNRFIVASKFSRLPGFSTAGDFQEMIDTLCDGARIKHRFLNTADLSAHTVLSKKAGRDQGAMGEAKMRRIRDYGDAMLEEFRGEARIKVKLVVTEIMQSDRQKNVRKLISPLVDALVPKLQTDFGFFHTAIIVGPWYLEWTDAELVIPKRMVSGRAIISADVDTLEVPEEGLRAISDKISEVVVRWNTEYRYRNTPARGANREGNCQDFVDDILRAIGVQLDFEGALGQFIQRMRKRGKCILEFAPCAEFRDFFSIPEKSWVFATHRELDEFCCRIRDQCLDVYMSFASEWSLLKSFDRAFWLRYLKDQEDERYAPLPPEEDSIEPLATGCPFDDPRKTKSYV